jgi:squalene-hopene/tetraprenyl-beta-curcumene cyclase
MRSTPSWVALPTAFVLALAACLHGQAPRASRPPDNPYPYAANEPKAKSFSLAKSGEYLDGVAGFWMRQNSCGFCHANFPYLMARPLLKGPPTPLVPETRQFMASRKSGPRVSFSDGGVAGLRPKPTPLSFYSPAERVGIAFALAWDDAHTTGKLRPDTRQALRQMWAAQRPQGYWYKMGCGSFPPLENDQYYSATLAALAAGVAPEGYTRTTEAQDGLTRLRRYLTKAPVPDLHHRAMLLWASLHVEGLTTSAEREETVKALLARQRGDGGWSMANLRRRHAPPGSPSDGYATAFAVYVLRQAGLSASRSEVARGVAWLKSNQRASGRWFTPSPAAGDQTEGGVGTRDLYVQNLGTAFAVLALKACDS